MSVFVMSCHILSCLIMSCLIMSCFIMSCLVSSCLISSHLVLSLLIMSCLVLSHLGSSRLVSYHHVFFSSCLIQTSFRLKGTGVALRNVNGQCYLKQVGEKLHCIAEEISKASVFRVETGALVPAIYQIISVEFNSSSFGNGKPICSLTERMLRLNFSLPVLNNTTTQ